MAGSEAAAGPPAALHVTEPEDGQNTTAGEGNGTRAALQRFQGAGSTVVMALKVRRLMMAFHSPSV